MNYPTVLGLCQKYQLVEFIEDWCSIQVIHEESIAHMERCGKLALRFAEFCKLDQQIALLFVEAATLHDIGKLALNPSVLYKKKGLTADEFRHIQSHVEPQIENWDALPILIQHVIMNHHERVDGAGYLGKMMRECVTFAAAMSVIDVFDALTHKRCYHEPMTELDVLTFLTERSGAQFDGTVVRLFLEMYYA